MKESNHITENRPTHTYSIIPFRKYSKCAELNIFLYADINGKLLIF